jgi:hypothetical protein
MGRAEKFALVQSQLVMWALVAVVAYLLATNVSVVLAAALVAPLVIVYAWIVWRIDHPRRSSS